MSEKVAKALIRRHPEYASRLFHWAFLRATYDGGREWFEDNLFRYWKEGDDEFEARKKRAYRFNHSREIVDLVNKYLFRAQVNRGKDNVPDSVSRFWNAATKDGMSIDYLIRQISKSASIFGRIYIVVDSSRSVNPLISQADARNAGIRTFAYIVNPIDALDMSFDEDGNLNWILIRETYRSDKDFVEGSGNVEERLRLWTKNDWTLFRISEYEQNTQIPLDAIISSVENKKYVVEIVDQADHNLGVVPVIPHDNVEHDSDYYSPSLINDIAYQDRAVANYLSNLDAIIQDQTFSQLAIPAQALMPGEEEQTKNKLIEMGTKRIFLYNAEAGVAPMFLSPDPKQVNVIITVVRQIINEIYHSVGMAGERTKQDNSMGIDNSSGVAKAYDFERINALLTTKANALQRVERELCEMVMLWNADSPVNDDSESWVKYAETFDVRGLVDEFDMAAKLQKIGAPATVRRLQMSHLVDKMMPVISESDRRAIDAELEQWPVMEMVSDGQDSPDHVESPDGSDDIGDPRRPTQGSVQPERFGSTDTPDAAE